MYEMSFCSSHAVTFIDSFANLLLGFVESAIGLLVAVVIYQLGRSVPFWRSGFILMLLWFMLGVSRFIRGMVMTLIVIGSGHASSLDCGALLSSDVLAALSGIGFGTVFLSMIGSVMLWFPDFVSTFAYPRR